MAASRSRGNANGDMQRGYWKNASPAKKRDQLSQRKTVFGWSSNSDLLVWMKRRALSPCEPRASMASDRKLRGQTLKIREALRLSNEKLRPRKRKLDQFLGCTEIVAASRLPPKNSKNRNVESLDGDQLSSVSCLPSAAIAEHSNQLRIQKYSSSGSFLTSEHAWQEKLISPNSLDEATNWVSSNKNNSFLIDTDESALCSFSTSRRALVVQEAQLLDSSDSFHSSDLSSSVEKLEPPVEYLICRVNKYGRPVIPIGPAFQADIPEWNGPINKANIYGIDADSECLKWLGTKIWPIKGVNTTITKVIGKGRPKSCFCSSPGSSNCTKRHMIEARRRLQSNLGPAFLNWKFDEMGESVSKSWNSREEKMFESLMKNSPLSNGMSFWKNAAKHFPLKCKRSILSYYYNVFIPRCMSLESSSQDQVLSDDDQVDGNDDEDVEVSTT